MYYVYVLKSKTVDELYVGLTNNLERRLSEHNEGKEISTKRYKPWSLIYYEAYSVEGLARLREKRLKQHGNAMKELKKRIGLHPAPSSKRRSGAGFTLIEILISIALIAILISVFVFRLNPAEILAKARNNQRALNVNVILNAVGQNIANNSGSFNCASGDIPTTTAKIIASTTSSTYDIYDCLIPQFMSSIPVDPKTGTSGNSSSTYNTKYTIIRNATTSQITVAAPDAELGETISVTR